MARTANQDLPGWAGVSLRALSFSISLHTAPARTNAPNPAGSAVAPARSPRKTAPRADGKLAEAPAKSFTLAQCSITYSLM